MSANNQLTSLPTKQPIHNSKAKLILAPAAITIPGKELDYCKKYSGKSSRPFLNWDCRHYRHKEDINEDNLTYNETSIPNLPDILTRNVNLFGGGNWGQLCNRLQLYAGFIEMVKASNSYSSSLLAFNAEFSPQIWNLDLAAISKNVPGVLLECLQCDGKSQSGFIRCNYLIIHGKVYVIDSYVFKATVSSQALNFYYGSILRNKGYMNALNEELRPKKQLLFIVDEIMKEFRSKLKPNEKSMAIHRRYMDSVCYIYMNRGDDHCPRYIKSQVGTELRRFQEDFTVSPYKTYFLQSDCLRKMDEGNRTFFERRHNLMIACNFTLNDVQVEIIKKTWEAPLLARPFVALLSTDGYDRVGDTAFYASRLPVRIEQLKEYENPACFEDKRIQYMLAEMLGMVLTDYHMDNPLSSCAPIVVQWRKTFANKSVGSSYPPICYDGYYKKN